MGKPEDQASADTMPARLADRDVARLRASLVDIDDELAARFEIVREAGSGGMGVVYEAIERATSRPVAVKVMTEFGGPNERARFAAEAEVLEHLDHPAIVDYVCHGTTARAEPYLAMEWLVGENLSARLERGPLSVADTIVLGERIADALAHAHAAGVVHRDLKPSNIFLVDDQPAEAHLIDFGVAKRTDRDLTATGQLIGTPGYMAPEQARGDRAVGASADLFALGCVLYKALAGRDAFTGTEVMEVLARLLLEDPAPLAELVPGVPPRLARLVHALMAKQPGERLASAAHARDELRELRVALAAADSKALERPSPNVPVAPPARRPRWPIAAAAGAAVVAIALVVVFARGGTADPPAACTDVLRGGCRAACDAGDGAACHLLARTLHGNTVGIAVDHEAARAADARACELGVPQSCVEAASSLFKIAKLHPAGDARRERWLAEAERLLATACTAKHADACRRLGRALSKTQGPLRPDPARSFALVEQACNLDLKTACDALEDMITDAANDGTPAMRASARRTIDAACTRGVPVITCKR